MWKDIRMSFTQILSKSNTRLVCPLSSAPGPLSSLSKRLLGIRAVLLLVQDQNKK